MTSSQNDPSGGRPVLRRALVIGGVAAAGATAFGIAAAISSGRIESSVPASSFPGPSGPAPTVAEPSAPSSTPTPGINLAAHSLADPTSIWVVVNKLRALNPVDYLPADLSYPEVPYVNRQPMRQAAADALVSLFTAASNEAGFALAVQSAFRPYQTQASVYAGWVASLGQAGADATSARPGHSEHQTGWAIDVVGASGRCALEICWGDTAEGQWVAANAYRFGFVVRYRAEATPITGYEAEPYHLRYLGPELAQYLHDSGIIALEQLFGLPDAPDYPPGTP